MNSTVNTISNLVLLFAQVVNVSGDLIPSDDKAIVAGILSLAQLVIARVAHVSNPDGTSAKEPFVVKN